MLMDSFTPFPGTSVDLYRWESLGQMAEWGVKYRTPNTDDSYTMFFDGPRAEYFARQRYRKVKRSLIARLFEQIPNGGVGSIEDLDDVSEAIAHDVHQY